MPLQIWGVLTNLLTLAARNIIFEIERYCLQQLYHSLLCGPEDYKSGIS